jgi:hypothetical protein
MHERGRIRVYRCTKQFKVNKRYQREIAGVVNQVKAVVKICNKVKMNEKEV